MKECAPGNLKVVVDVEGTMVRHAGGPPNGIVKHYSVLSVPASSAFAPRYCSPRVDDPLVQSPGRLWIVATRQEQLASILSGVREEGREGVKGRVRDSQGTRLSVATREDGLATRSNPIPFECTWIVGVP